MEGVDGDAHGVVSDFITVQSLTNFSGMTGAIVAAWGGLRVFNPVFNDPSYPFALCLFFGLLSFGVSKPGELHDVGKWGQALFIAFINALTLFAAVMAASEAAATATG